MAETFKNFLLKSQDYELFKAITDLGFEPAMFQRSNVSSGWTGGTAVKFAYLGTDFYFIFDYSGADGRRAVWSPGADKPTTTAGNKLSWAEQLNLFKNWMGYLRRELETPDVWGALSAETGLVHLDDLENDNRLFDETEKEEISQGLSEIKKYLFETQQLNAEQQKFIEQRFDYVEGALSRVGRLDWKNLLMNALMTIILFLSFPQSTAGELFRFAKVALPMIFGSQGLLVG